MAIEKILFATQFKELAFNALEAVSDLHASGLREIILAYVIPREEVAFVPYGGYLKDEEERLRVQARVRFEDWQVSIRKRGVESKIVIEVGETVPKIIEIAEREKVDMIVAGKKKRSQLEKLYVGTHTFDLLRRTKKPILIPTYMARFQWNEEIIIRVNDRFFSSLLLATDWSEPSERALETIASFKPLVKNVRVAHVIGSKLSRSLDKAQLARLEQESNSRLADYCKRLEGAGITAEPHLSSGKTAPEIVRLAREQNAGMIVMGTTGKDRIEQLWVGSVSHRVAESSERPVLLVP
jgi:nucleotide-binding universal stress UspA family protein